MLVGAQVSAFQFSYAHTFGLSIFIFPALIVSCLSANHIIKRYFLYIFSIGMLISWGTGLVGDFSNLWGKEFFKSSGILNQIIMGLPYATILHTLEYVSYLFFAFVFLNVLPKSRDANFDTYGTSVIK